MIDRFVVIALGLLVLLNFVVALLATMDWSRRGKSLHVRGVYYAVRAYVRGWTKEDWQFVKACGDLVTVAVGLAVML